MRMVLAVSAMALLLAFTLVRPVPTSAQSGTGPSCGFPTGACCSGEICVASGFCEDPSGTCYNCPCGTNCPLHCPTAAPVLSWPMLGALLVALLTGGGFYLVRQQRQQP
jgi:hypothetical protein